ncbi:Transforming acidic coiled-coil-containing protein 3 [Irineochytrium annulatum]|nr:Transforming acidic coiled-coil-containing protein 3 [Irineochytrium annulatum]
MNTAGLMDSRTFPYSRKEDDLFEPNAERAKAETPTAVPRKLLAPRSVSGSSPFWDRIIPSWASSTASSQSSPPLPLPQSQSPNEPVRRALSSASLSASTAVASAQSTSLNTPISTPAGLRRHRSDNALKHGTPDQSRALWPVERSASDDADRAAGTPSMESGSMHAWSSPPPISANDSRRSSKYGAIMVSSRPPSERRPVSSVFESDGANVGLHFIPPPIVTPTSRHGYISPPSDCTVYSPSVSPSSASTARSYHNETLQRASSPFTSGTPYGRSVSRGGDDCTATPVREKRTPSSAQRGMLPAVHLAAMSSDDSFCLSELSLDNIALESAPSGLATPRTESDAIEMEDLSVAAVRAFDSTPRPKQGGLSGMDGGMSNSIDPLSCSAQDWMMKFETPMPTTAVRNPATERRLSQLVARESNTTLNGSSASLLDMHNFYTSPSSVLKYTDRDMEQMKSKVMREMAEKYEKEFEVVKADLLESSHGEIQRLKKTLNEWHAFAQNAIDAKELQESKANDEMAVLRGAAEECRMEAQKTRLSLEAMARRARDAEESFNDLKKHAEMKIEDANIEIERVRSTLEKELTALRTKLSRAEIRIQSQERTIEMKTEECFELTKICDALLTQIEGGGGRG